MISFYADNPKHISILFCPYQVIIPLSSHLSVLTSPTVCFRPRYTAT